MEEIVYHLDKTGWKLQSIEGNEALYRYNYTSLMMRYDVALNLVIMFSPHQDNEIYQFYFGVSPSLEDLKDGIRLSLKSFNKLKKR